MPELQFEDGVFKTNRRAGVIPGPSVGIVTPPPPIPTVSTASCEGGECPLGVSISQKPIEIRSAPTAKIAVESAPITGVVIPGQREAVITSPPVLPTALACESECIEGVELLRVVRVPAPEPPIIGTPSGIVSGVPVKRPAMPLERAGISLSPRCLEPLNGWSPVFALVDNLTGGLVLAIVEWTGGDGTPPGAPVYVGEDGYVLDVEDAVNIQGDSASSAPAFTLPAASDMGGGRFVRISGGLVSYADGPGGLPAIGYISGAVVAGELTDVRIGGRLASLAGLTEGLPVYLGPSGMPVQEITLDAGTLQNLGLADSSTSMIVEIDTPTVIT